MTLLAEVLVSSNLQSTSTALPVSSSAYIRATIFTVSISKFGGGANPHAEMASLSSKRVGTPTFSKGVSLAKKRRTSVKTDSCKVR